MSSRKEKSTDVYFIPTDCPVDRSIKNPWWHIDRETFRFKLHFFLYLSALGAAVPYIVVFAKDRVGISASSLGAVLTAQMFLFIFTKPMVGYVADYFNKLKIIITVLTVVNLMCYFLLLAIPNYELQQAGLGNRTDLDVLSDYVTYSELCEKHQDLLHPTAVLTVSSLSESSYTSVPTRVFVVCFQGNSDTLSCLEQCSVTQATVKTTFYHKSQSFCEIIVSGDSQLFNKSDCSVECIWDKSFLCRPENNASSPSECVEQICPPNADASTDCIYFGNLKDFCPSVMDSPIKSKNKISNDPIPVNDFETYQFWVFTVLFTISSICTNAIFTLSDTACWETIQKTGGDFGHQRLWGAIGWGSSAPIAGFINDYTGDYLVSWIVMAVLLILFLWNISKLDLVKPHFSKNILKDVGTVFKSREFLSFEVSVFMNGVGTGVIWFYLIWFLTTIGGSKLLCGLSLAVQCAFGVIPLMFFSGWVIRKVGHFNVLTMSLAAYFIRFLWYSYLHNPWLVLPIEFLHGLTYGLYYTTLASYGKMSAKPGTEATTQAVIFSTHEGLGAGVGCVLAGIGFDSIGGHKTFYYTSVFCACGVVLSLISSLLVDNRTGEMKVTSAASTEALHSKQNGNDISCSKFKKLYV